MIKLTLKRRYRGSQYTIGSLYINNQYFCDTLEDRDRGLSQQMSLDNIKLKKVYGSTAIPTGTYRISILLLISLVLGLGLSHIKEKFQDY